MTRYLLATVSLLLAITLSHAAPPAEEVKAAVAKGVGFLKANNPPDDHKVGRVALTGMALLAAGETAKDATVSAAANHVRANCIQDDNTYHIALSILFLDKLADPSDIALIQLQGVKLLAGQTADGGWGYNSGGALNAEQWRTALRGKLTTGRLHPEVAKLYGQIRPGTSVQGDDNSNTQFGLIALWVAGKHGVPIKEAVARIENRFLRTQSPSDFGWAYSGVGSSTPSMTCAGLLGLAVAAGVKTTTLETPKTPDADKEEDPFSRPNTGEGDSPEKKPAPNDLRKDARTRAIERGLNALGRILQGQQGTISSEGGFGGAGDLYFFWSVERVAVTFGVDKIGAVNWYDWGADPILKSQAADGSWSGSYGKDVSTAFAILFLTRANFAVELSDRIRGKVISGELRGGGGSSSGSSIKFDQNGQQNRPQGPNAPALADVRPTTEADLICLGLLEANPTEWEKRLKAAKEGKGPQHTAGLTLAANRLERDKKKQVRDALAERLTRMTPETLKNMLVVNEPELRRAACLAAAMKDDKTHVPDLIARITDTDDAVVRAARAGLKALTQQDFGPDGGASDEAKQQAAVRWKFWYSSDGQKK